MDDIKAAAEIARLLADPVRLTILHFLTWGPASVAELVALTGASQPNVSNHLKLLRERGMVLGDKTGRQIVYRLASPAVAELFNALSWAALGKAEPASLAATGALVQARTCYDHLAGRLGVALLQGLVAARAITEPREAWDTIEPGPSADGVLQRLGIDLDEAGRDGTRRRFAFACPDWSEHGHSHLGGLLGAVLCEHCRKAGWIERNATTRAVQLTPSGADALEWLIGRDGRSAVGEGARTRAP